MLRHFAEVQHHTYQHCAAISRCISAGGRSHIGRENCHSTVCVRHGPQVQYQLPISRLLCSVQTFVLQHSPTDSAMAYIHF